jgi:signal transduction histidine kinase
MAAAAAPPQQPRPSLRARVRAWSLRRDVAVAAGGFGLILAVLFTTTGLAFADFIEKGNGVVYHWQPAVTRSQTLLADLVNQETGLRGYALTADASFLDPYHAGAAAETTDAAALRRLISSRADLTAMLRELQQRIDEWRTTVAEPVIQHVAQGDAQVGTLLDSLGDRPRFDAIRSSSNALTAAITRTSEHARTARRNGAIVAVIALSITAVVVTAASIVVWRALHSRVLRPVDSLARQTRAVAAGQTNRVIRASGPPELSALGADVEAMRRRIAEELAHVEAARDELRRSNADLEQFAYVASHDLSEPLRKIANFTQLLERQYGDALDDQAKRYIGFAVDGAKRMQALIADLLLLSRVGRTTEAFAEVDTDAALERALMNLDDKISATGAGVGHSDLPTVLGDESLLIALFENLVGNSLKYRSDEPPLIVVTAVRNPAVAGWEFAVSDNGIGIDPQYADRIFAIFQRLHLRDEYEGTGIGLALCRKIVEFHGGRIWLDTSAAQGATFRFTIPDRPPPERHSG